MADCEINLILSSKLSVVLKIHRLGMDVFLVRNNHAKTIFMNGNKCMTRQPVRPCLHLITRVCGILGHLTCPQREDKSPLMGPCSGFWMMHNSSVPSSEEEYLCHNEGWLETVLNMTDWLVWYFTQCMYVCTCCPKYPFCMPFHNLSLKMTGCNKKFINLSQIQGVPISFGVFTQFIAYKQTFMGTLKCHFTLIHSYLPVIQNAFKFSYYTFTYCRPFKTRWMRQFWEQIMTVLICVWLLTLNIWLEGW